MNKTLRLNEFIKTIFKRLLGKIKENEFKNIRLLNGLYLQLHSYMLRISIPNAILTGKQLKILSILSLKYDKGYFHITTRQNIQFNWIVLSELPNLLNIINKINLCTINTAGNCIRQITCDPFTNIYLDEFINPNLYLFNLRYWLNLNNEFEDLPRKIKICVTSSINDRVLLKFNDIGIYFKKKYGKVIVYITLGGGLGRLPLIGKKYFKINTEQMLKYLYSFIRIYYTLSCTERYKSRTKFLIFNLNKQILIKLIKTESLNCIYKNKFYFIKIKTENFKIKKIKLIIWPINYKFKHWYKNYTYPHKFKFLRIIEISTNKINNAPGDITYHDIKTLSLICQKYSFDEIRLSLKQTILLPYVHIKNIIKIYRYVKEFNIYNIVSCPGLDYCTLANARSISLTQKLIFANINFCSIKISGCINSCSQHHISDIGFIGINKKSSEVYQMLIGGSFIKPINLAFKISKTISSYKILGILTELKILIKIFNKDQFEPFKYCFKRIKLFLK